LTTRHLITLVITGPVSSVPAVIPATLKPFHGQMPVTDLIALDVMQETTKLTSIKRSKSQKLIIALVNLEIVRELAIRTGTAQ
jgi:hypothetical protein